MDEPVGRTIDGTPWEEPRGPHVPDGLVRIARRLNPVSWLFVLAAFVNGVVPVVDRLSVLRSSPGLDAATYVQSILGLILAVIPPVATALFGAAYFARHPGGWSTHRAVAIGVSLMAIGELMHTAGRFLGDVFRAVTPPADELGIVAPSEVAYAVVATVLIGFGTFAVARGLREARQASDAAGSRARHAITAVIVLFAVWSIALNVVVLSQYAADDGNGPYLAQGVIQTVVGWLPLAAQSYLAIILVAGFIAGERPVTAWRLATAGVLAILVFGNGIAVTIDTVSYVVVTPTTDFAVWNLIYFVPAAGWALGYILLLAAFVRGLPSRADGPAA